MQFRIAEDGGSYIPNLFSSMLPRWGRMCVCTKEALCLITHPLNHPCPLVCPISPGNECVSTHVAATCWDDGCLLKTLRGGSQERHSSCTARTKPCLNVEKAQSTLASLAQVPHFSFRFCAPFSSRSLDAAVFQPLLVLHKPRVSLVAAPLSAKHFPA